MREIHLNNEEYFSQFRKIQEGIDKSIGIKPSNVMLCKNNMMIQLKHKMKEMGIDDPMNSTLWDIIERNMSNREENAIVYLMEIIQEFEYKITQETEKMLLKKPDGFIEKIQQYALNFIRKIRKKENVKNYIDNMEQYKKECREELREYEKEVDYIYGFDIKRDIVPTIVETLKQSYGAYYGNKSIKEIKEELGQLGLEDKIQELDEEINKNHIVENKDERYFEINEARKRRQDWIKNASPKEINEAFQKIRMMEENKKHENSSEDKNAKKEEYDEKDDDGERA